MTNTRHAPHPSFVPPKVEPIDTVRHHLAKVRRADFAKVDLQAKNRGLRAAVLASPSMPVLTIATRDAVEEEMKARRRADFLRMEADARAAEAVSLEALDSQPRAVVDGA